MPPTGSTFMDWQQVEHAGPLLIDDDISWSEPPQRRRRRITEEPIRARRRVAVIEYEPEPLDDYASHDGYEPLIDRVPAEHLPTDEAGAWNPPTAAHSHFDEMMAEWNAAYGAGSSRDLDTSAERAFDLSDPGPSPAGQGTRRTVVITGHGDERYLPAPRRRRSSELRFHERAGFSPDRAGLWAVLLGIALVIGAMAH